MTDSYIQTGVGGTLFAGRDAVELYRATALSSALGMLRMGVRPTRGLTKVKALAMCKRYTGKEYKSREIDAAVADLRVWIETMRSALPIRQGDGA